VDILKKDYAVTVICFDAAPTSEFEVVILKQQGLSFFRKVILSFLLGIRWFSLAHHVQFPYRYILKTLKHDTFDLIIANDVESLPLAFEAADQFTGKVIFDAHEYAPRHFEDKFMWRLFFQPLNIYLCKKYIPQTAAMITIGSGLANEYEKNFHVKPVIITNANHFHKLNPTPLQNSRIRLVHHGIATPSRKLELMIEMMDHLDDRFTLDMYLVTVGASSKTMHYTETLKGIAAKNSRVRILPPIKADEIAFKINEYDMGVFLIPPVNFNYANTLPNKLFDFIQARLAVVVGPTPEMAEIVNTYKIGVVSTDFTPKSLAEKLSPVTAEQLHAFKQNSTVAAEKLNAEENKKILIALLEKVLQGK
jgi:glycosyltransferase involved in cell wall biosynthesis